MSSCRSISTPGCGRRSSSGQPHAEADERFRQAFAHRIPPHTSTLVLAEVHRLLLFRADPRLASHALGRIDASDRLTIHFPDRGYHVAAGRWLERIAAHAVTHTGAASFAMVDATRCRTALSFGGYFVIAGFTLWRVGHRRGSR